MDMNQYRKHLAAQRKTIKESREQQDAKALAQALADFDKASRRLLNAWNDAIDTIGNNDIQMPQGYPFRDDFQEVAKDISTFVQSFTKHLKTVK